MQYRTKLYLAFIAISVISSISGLSILYVEAREFVFKELQSKVKSVAATTAALIDPELAKKVQTKADENSPDYQEIQKILRKARNANRRDDIYVKFIYTIRPSPNNPQEFEFVVDAEESPADFSHLGDVDPDVQVAEHFNHVYSPNHLITDQWGVWLSGFVPIYDKDGNYVITVGADLRAADVLAEFHKLLRFEIPALLASILLAVILATFLSRRASLSLACICAVVKEIGKGNFTQEVQLHTHDEFEEVGAAINAMEQGLKERERLKISFARYVSSSVFDQIITSEKLTKLEGERKKVTLLFSDIHHFTALSEKLDPENIVSLLNTYFEQMLEVVFSHQGTLDKFLGDGIMVEFGAPLDDADQEDNAVLAALEMQRALTVLNTKWAGEGKPALTMSIGIHTGPAVVGNIGSEQRMEYTAIGDTVNVASRLEQACKKNQVPILISETTYQGLKKKFIAKKIGSLALPGREKEVVAYAIDIPHQS